MNKNTDDDKKNGSILIIFLVVILIGIAMGGYYLWQDKNESDELLTEPIELTEVPIIEPSIIPSQDENNSNSDWTTYTNDYFRYDISYPKEFKLSDKCYNNLTKKYEDYLESPKWLVILDRNMDDNFPYCDSDFPQMDIIIKSFNEEININEMMEQSDTDIEDSVQIGNNTWARQIMTEPSIFDDSYATYLFLNKNGKGYEIDIKNTNANGLHDAIINQIIETLNFN